MVEMPAPTRYAVQVKVARRRERHKEILDSPSIRARCVINLPPVVTAHESWTANDGALISCIVPAQNGAFE